MCLCTHCRYVCIQFVCLFSCQAVFNSLQPHGLEYARPHCPSPSPRVCPSSCSPKWWCHPTISSSVVPFSFCLWSFPALESFQWVCFSHQVAEVLELQLQHQSFQWIFRTDFLQDGLVGSPCSSSDSQESSPAPQFKSINSLAFSLPYGPALTSVHDYWKDHRIHNLHPIQFIKWKRLSSPSWASGHFL